MKSKSIIKYFIATLVLAAVFIIAWKFRFVFQGETLVLENTLKSKTTEVNSDAVGQLATKTVDYSGNFLTHTTTLAQLDIQNVRIEEGNGALLYADLLKLDPKNPSDVSKAADLFVQAARKKDFSIFPELEPYPMALDDFIKPFTFSFVGSRDLSEAVINYASDQSLPDDKRQIILESILVVGRQMTFEKDFSTVVELLHGLDMEKRAAQALEEYYSTKGNTEKSTMYKLYLNETESIHNALRAALLGEVEVFKDLPLNGTTKIISYLNRTDSFKEVVAQSESLLALMLISHTPNAGDAYNLAKKVLNDYAQGNNPVIANMARQILVADDAKVTSIVNASKQDANGQ